MHSTPCHSLQGRSLSRIPLPQIQLSPFQPRRTFSETSIAELAESIRLHGLLTPLLVRRIGADSYELIAGERRLRALTLLDSGWAEAIVLRAFDDDCAMLSLIENIQRENLHYLDEAEACRAILRRQNLTQEALARALSVSPSTLANRLRLLKLPDALRARLRATDLTERHARALLRLSDESAQMQLAEEAAARHLSVKQLEARVEQLSHRPPPRPRVSPVIRDNRIIINAILDTVKQLNHIGIAARSRVEECTDGIEIVVKIPAAAPSQKS